MCVCVACVCVYVCVCDNVNKLTDAIMHGHFITLRKSPQTCMHVQI